MSIFSDFFEWLLPDPPKIPEPKVNGAEFQIQRPEKCQFLYGEFEREQPHLVRSEMKQVGTGIPNNVMVMQVVWSQGEIESLDKLYINDLDADGNDFNLPSGTTSNGLHFGGTVVKYKHVLDGGAKRFSVGGYTLEEFNGYGNAYSIIAVIYDSSLMPGKPKVTGSGKGKKILNLSNSLVQYTNNAIDVYYDYCVNGYGARIPSSRFINTELLDERAFADTSVTNSDGVTQKMMTFNGRLDGNKNAVDNLNEMRKQMRIFMPLVDGKYKVLIERPRTPENFTINDSNKMSDWKISNVNSSDLLSKVIVKFKDKEQLGKEAKVEYPDGGSDDNTITVTLNGVNNAYEAMQYAYIIYLRSSSSRKASGQVNKEALPYYVGQIIKMDEPRLGMVGKNWLITNKSVQDDIVDFDLIEYDETIYPWVAHPIPTYPVANVPNNRSVNPPTGLVKSEDNGDTIISWSSDYDDFDVQKIVGGVLTDLGSTAHKFINLGNLPQGTHEVMVRAVNGLDYPSEWVTFSFTVNTPATPTGLTVTDSYIEWTHPNLAGIREFIIETTENTENDTVAYSQPPSSNGTQRLEISGIKAGDYDVSVTAKGLNNLLSLPATLTNAQIDGITPIVTPIINDAIGGFTNEPHTWTALNNFTGGLQKNGQDLDDRYFRFLGANGSPDDWLNQDGYVSARPFAEKHPPLSHGTMLNFGASSSGDVQIFVDDAGWMATRGNSWQGVWSNWNPVAHLNKSQTYSGNNTFTGINNFTGQLLKNGSPVIGLEDLTYNSDESLAIAATTIEQFYKDQEAGLYDDFDQGVGSLAAGFVNSIINQANFLIANNANIDKLKSSAIEVSGSGYALNQNPTWQDTLDGWWFDSDVVPVIEGPSANVRVANQILRINTTQNDGRFFCDPTPISKEGTYTISVWVYQTGSAKQYLAVSFLNSGGSVINAFSTTPSDATGWLSISSFHYFGLSSQAHTGDWKRYDIKIGKNGDATIPTGAASVRLGMLVNYSGDFANTTVYLQDYRIEKSNGRTHIENGAIQTKHLVLDGDGAITFDTVGADAAGSAASAEANAKAYAFPATSAGSLAYLDSIGSTEITSGAVTTPKIATQAIEAQHLKLSGSGSITFDTVGADQAGSAASAESAAKEYASKIAPIEVNAGEGLSWGFETGADSFTAVNTSITHSTGRLVLTTTSTDPQLIRESLNYSGSENYLVSVRVKSVGQSITTAPILYYRTGGTGAHGWSDSYRDTISNITLPADEWVYYQFDMRNQSHGGTDYIDNNITAIRIDFATQSGVTFEIDSVQVGSTGGASRNPADNSIDSTKITSDAVTAPKIAANAITADKIEANALNGKVITGSTVQTASDTSRRVIVKDDGTYLLWAGSGSKNDTNAIFYIKANGEGFVKGEFFQGEILETASKNGSFTSGSPWSITATNHSSAGKSVKIDIAASFVATFTGNKTTENYTLICTVKRGTTTVGTRTFYNAPAFYNSISGTTEISITGQSFVTDSSTATGNRSYSLEVSLGGGGGTYNNVDVDLSIYTLENKLES